MGRGLEGVNLVVATAATPLLPAGQPQDLSLAVVAAMDALGVPPQACLSLVLTGDEELRRLNLRHRGQDAPTDVLAFPGGPGAADATDGPYLGDIIVSVERAAAQATRLGHSLDEELRLLTVHGLLHLLGHDHATAAGAAEMEALERDLGVRR